MTTVKRRGRLAGLLVLVLLVGAGFGILSGNGVLQSSYDSVMSRLFGQYMPEFSLPDVDDKLHSSSAWQGEVVVLNFWATWCPPCIREMPMFDAMQNTYGEQGVRFVGIAIDERSDVELFIREKEINYTILLGDSGSIAMSRALGNENGGLPYTAVFDRSGKLVATLLGEVERERLNNLLAVLASS